MKVALLFVVTLVAVGLVVFAVVTDVAWLLATAPALAALCIQEIAGLRLEDVPKSMRLPAILGATIYRRRPVRVSASYLVRIKVDEMFLLVRGHRITTQFQPVGGVYKVRSNVLRDLETKLGVSPDVRFARDVDNANDLRLMMQGRALRPFLQWLGKRQDLEVGPWREFFEELIEPGVLNATTFATPHFEFVGTYSTRLHYDRHVGCQQLIVFDLFDLHPSELQSAELCAVMQSLPDAENISQGQQIAFFKRSRLTAGAAPDQPRSEYDIAPTARWIVAPGDGLIP